MGWYKTGTVSLANGSTTVTGVGTDFVSNVNSGAIFCAPDGKIYEVDSIVSATSMLLVVAYAGSDVAGASYAIAPTQSYIVALATQAANLLNTFSSFRDAYLAGDLVGAGLELKGILTDPSQLPASPNVGDAYMIGASIYVWVGSDWKSSSIQGPQGEVGDVNPANLTAAANALASQTAAAASATTATGAATTATTQAGIATVQATTATTEATTATTQAGIATVQATAAAGSASSLSAALASFRAKYLGEFAADPTVDGNGNALTAGAEYYNTVEQKLRLYSGTGWGDYDATAETATQNAVLSAAAAAASATTATTGATTATTQAGISTTGATTATGAATTATTQAGIATTQATTATGAATTATSEASIATTQAQAAAASATAAAQSAVQASQGQINSDWNATSGIAKILNKPTFAAVAMSGSYSDLTGAPTLATVATTGKYGDMIGPIPIWNQSTTGNAATASVANALVASAVLTAPTLAATPTAGDSSLKVPTTAFVATAITTALANVSTAWTYITPAVVAAAGGTYLAAAGGAYDIDTSNGPVTITLPVLTANQTVAWRDYASTFATNNATIATGSNKVNGVVTNIISDINNETRQLTYTDATVGCLIA